MKRTSALALLALLSLALAASPAFADKIFLKSGGSFEGKVVKETATEVVFKVRGLGKQTFKKSDVLRIEKSSGVYDEYEKRRKAVGKDDADGWFELGKWCEEQNLRKEAKKAYRAAVAADPDHAGARDALGYVSYEGEWITKVKHEEILAEIRAREEATVAGLALGDTYEDAKARFGLKCPKGWEKEAEDGEKVTFTGPALGKVPLVIRLGRDDPVDDLDTAVGDWKDDTKLGCDGFKMLAEPSETKLAGSAARLCECSFTRDDLAPEALTVEQHDVVMTCPAGTYRLSLTCGAGYFERLRPFFTKVVATVKVLEKPPDVTVKEHGFAFCYPDDSYAKQDRNPLRDQNGNPLPVPPDTTQVRGTRGGGYFVLLWVTPGKKEETTTLETLRDSLPDFCPYGLKLQDESKKVTVAGRDALTGKMGCMGGLGRWCVLIAGERTYRILFMNLANRMGQKYVDEDFNKFLANFKLL